MYKIAASLQKRQLTSIYNACFILNFLDSSSLHKQREDHIN